MKKCIAIICMIAMLFTFTSCGNNSNEGTGEGFVIAYSNGTACNTWRTQQIDAFTEHAEELKAEGIISEYIISNVDSTEAQIAALEDFINRGVDAIVANTDAGSALTPVLTKAVEAGIYVIGSGGVMEPSKYNVIVETDNYEYSNASMQYLAYEMGYKGKVIHLYGLEGGWEGGERRKEAVRSIVEENPGMEIIATSACSWNESQGNEAMAALLGAKGKALGADDICIYGEDVSFGVQQAYAAAGVNLPTIMGEYTYGWLREWNNNKDITSCVACYPPDATYNWLDVAILCLQGYEIDNDKTAMDYTLTFPMPYLVVRDDSCINEEWTSKIADTTEIKTLDEVLEGTDGMSDNDCLTGHYSMDEVKEMFFK